MIKKCLARMVAVILAFSTATSITYGLNDTEYYEARIKTSELGNYDMEIESHEVPSHEYLPIIGKEYFPYSVENFQSEVDNKYPYAVYESNPIVKVDVVFATGELDQIEAYKNYMATFTSLVQGGRNNVDANIDVLVQEVKTVTGGFSMEDADAATIYNLWDQYPNPNNFILAGDKIVNAVFSWNGYNANSRTRTPFNHFFIEKGTYDVTDFELSSTYAWHGCGVPSGYVFHYDVDRDMAYILLVGQRVEIYKATSVRSWLGQSTSETGGSTPFNRVYLGHNNTFGLTNFTLLASSNTSYATSGRGENLKLKMEGNTITVSKNGSTFLTYTDPNPIKSGGVGLFAGCTVSFSDVQLSYDKTEMKSLGESIQDVAWRDGSIRFVVHATDAIPKECDPSNPNKEADFAYTVAKLLNSNAYLVNLGRENNRQPLSEILAGIKQADGTEKGTYFYNKPISNAMDKAAAYIIEIARNLVKPTNWILVNTEVTWNTEYKDNEKDAPLNYGEHSSGNVNRKQPQDLFDEQILASYGTPITYGYTDDKILAEKWRYRHFPQYFDNSSILAGFAGQWIPDPVEVFEFTGKYRINYKRKDNPFHSDQSLTNIFDNYRYWSTNYDYIIRQ